MAQPIPISQAIKESKATLGAIRKSRRLAPQRADFEREFPGKVDVVTTPRGNREWRLRVEARDRNGNKTRDGQKLESMMMPYVRSEAARARGRRQGPTVPMKGPEGTVHHVPAHLERDTAARGFHSGTRHRGKLDMMTLRGVLWSLKRTWRPVTRGSPGVHEAPDGTMWRAQGARWVRL